LTLVVGCSFALVLAAFSAADARGFRRSIELQRQIAQLKSRNDALAKENASLVQEIHGLRKDPAALERAAREELGFVKPGEVVITLEAP
jgi:cell division protein FtsB